VQKDTKWIRLNERKVDAECEGQERRKRTFGALLGIDGEGWFPLRVRAGEYEAEMVGTYRE